ncbi:hypothetical protein H3V53_09735 [Paraburkholderia bengalensis]|uniref:Uncharacterized protein n=2 Tax=Paraburkholderia bengalensis TaxID=2747562 RepID=A0ABU8IPE9_9BURK
MMGARERSLRGQVEKWLGSASRECIRVTRFGHSRSNSWRYVCIEATHVAGLYSFVFFRHDDGSWCVFPPASGGFPASRRDFGLS